MAPIFLCACLRIMRERGAHKLRRREKLEKKATAAVAEGEALPQTPQSRQVTASQRTKVRALGLSLLLLLTIGLQALKYHKCPGFGINHTGKAIGIHLHQVALGGDTDERTDTQKKHAY